MDDSHSNCNCKLMQPHATHRLSCLNWPCLSIKLYMCHSNILLKTNEVGFLRRRAGEDHILMVDTLALVRRLEGQGVPSKQAEAITGVITEVSNDSLENVAQSFVSKGESQKVRRLEGQGVPSKQAEAITGVITEVSNDSLENVAQSFVSKGESQKNEMIHDSNLSRFKSNTEYQIDKVTAGQKAESANLNNKLDLHKRCAIHGDMGSIGFPTLTTTLTRHTSYGLGVIGKNEIDDLYA
ncbi:hypothetical protein Syun_022470 [Stephania yunnanensis]|uniref:Uncharacterized protein n=1 Tax=Stephania yunnanensis TaxID=152371 RepID=A0AAP0F7S7_9MAGN